MQRVPGLSRGSETLESPRQGQGDEWDGMDRAREPMLQSYPCAPYPFPRGQGLLLYAKLVGIHVEGIAIVIGRTITVSIVVMDFRAYSPHTSAIDFPVLSH